MSTPPFSSLAIVMTSQPHMVTVAGLVPCAVSGTMTRLRGSPCAVW